MDEKFIPVKYKYRQLPLKDTFSDCQDTFVEELRMFPSIQRDTDEWDGLYKIRTFVERTINHLKVNMCVAKRHTRNHLTTKADVFFAGIASLLTVIVAHRMHRPEYIRSLKPLIA